MSSRITDRRGPVDGKRQRQEGRPEKERKIVLHRRMVSGRSRSERQQLARHPDSASDCSTSTSRASAVAFGLALLSLCCSQVALTNAIANPSPPPPPPPPPDAPRGGGATASASSSKRGQAFPRSNGDKGGSDMDAAGAAAAGAAAAAAAAAAVAGDGGDTGGESTAAESTAGESTTDHLDVLDDNPTEREDAYPFEHHDQQKSGHKHPRHPPSHWAGQGNGGGEAGIPATPWDDGDGASAKFGRLGSVEGRRFEERWEGSGAEGEGRAWKHEDLKQLLQDLEDTEYGGGGAKRGRGRTRRRPRPSPAGGGAGGEGLVPGYRTADIDNDDGAPRRPPGSGWRSPLEEGGQENGEGGAGSHDELARRKQRQTNRRSVGRAAEAAEPGRGRGRGLTLGPPPPFPTTGMGAGAGAAGKGSSEQPGGSPGASDAPCETEADHYDAPPQFSKRRVRVTWEAEGWDGEETATELDSTEPAHFGSSTFDDGDGYYGSVADARSAESQQHYHEGLVGTLLQSGDFSDTGSAGTWTDGETEEFVVGHDHGRLDHLTAYGYHQRFSSSMVGSRVAGRGPGRRLVMPPGAPIGPMGSSARYGARTSILDLDYSAKVLDYGRKDGTGPPKTLTLRSWSRLLGSASIATLGAFLAVSPNNAPRDRYLALFRRNLGLIAASLVGPAVYSFLLYDGSKANINTYVRVVTFAFTWGYLITFALEIVAATFFQLCMLAAMEPAAFKLTPDVPAIFLPWVLREHGYVPSSLFSCVADLLSFCVGAPIVECAMMVWIVRRLGALPKRVASPLPTATATEGTTTTSNGSGKVTSGGIKKSTGPDEAAPSGSTAGGDGVVVASSAGTAVTDKDDTRRARRLGPFSRGATSTTAVSDAAKAARTAAEAAEAAQEPTHVHTYLLYVLGSAMGLKAACTMQRVLVYTREHHEHKAFFAFARGFFPLFELCGSIMAMNLARRDILGDKMNRLQLFFVAVSLNAYAVFRGTKPLFKWASSKPWDELQVKAWVFPRGMTPFQRARKGFASVAWSIVILRVTAHVIKTYWRLNRLHSSRLRRQHEMAAAAAMAAEQRAALALSEAIAGAARSS